MLIVDKCMYMNIYMYIYFTVYMSLDVAQNLLTEYSEYSENSKYSNIHLFSCYK